MLNHFPRGTAWNYQFSSLASHSMKRSFHTLEGKRNWAGFDSLKSWGSSLQISGRVVLFLLVKTIQLSSSIYIYVDIRKERSNNRIVCTWRKVMNIGHFQPCSVGATQTFQPPTLLTMFAPSPVCPTQRAVTFSLSSKGFVQWTTSGVWNDPCSFQHREPVDFRFQLRRMCTCCMRYV